jgi:hypothetical protein
MSDQMTLFDSPSESPSADAPQLRAMRGAYGRKEGETCGTCAWLHVKEFDDAKYFKCTKYGDSQGPGTDWRKWWPACGLWMATERRGARDRSSGMAR